MKRTLARIMPFGHFWNTFYRISERRTLANPIRLIDTVPEGPIDLVVSSGPQTTAANISLARHFGARNIYFGFPQWPVTAAFTVLLSPTAHRARGNVEPVLRPSEIDAADLPPARPLLGDGQPRSAALLVGGNTKHLEFTVESMQLLATRIAAVGDALPWIRWSVFNSRRTPDAPFRRFVEIVSDARHPPAIVDYRQAGLLSNSSAFATDLVLVTADSMSMISEAISARRPTGIVSPDGYRPPRHDSREMARHLQNRRAFPVAVSALEAPTLLAGAGSVEPMPISEIDRLAGVLDKALDGTQG